MVFFQETTLIWIYSLLNSEKHKGVFKFKAKNPHPLSSLYLITSTFHFILACFVLRFSRFFFSNVHFCCSLWNICVWNCCQNTAVTPTSESPERAGRQIPNPMTGQITGNQYAQKFCWHLTAWSNENTGWFKDLEEEGGDSEFCLIFIVWTPHRTDWIKVFWPHRIWIKVPILFASSAQILQLPPNHQPQVPASLKLMVI